MKKITIIFTGGTIAMRTNADGMLVPAVSGDELTASIPALRKMCAIQSTQFSNIPSAQVTPALMLALRSHIIEQLSNNDISGAVVVHGTDTLEETAFFLDACLSNIDLNGKPVVVTGAMRGNDAPSADGMANLLGSARVASADAARGRGVLVVMNDEIHAARHVTKTHTSSVQTFCSPSHMPIGTLTHAEDAQEGVRFLSAARRFTPNVDVSRETLTESPPSVPRVDIVTMHAGADAMLLNASVAAGAQAIVVQAVGAGNVNLELYAAIAAAIGQGVGIIISSRSPLGVSQPAYGYEGGGKTLAALGACFAHDLPAHKARLYAQLLLANAHKHADVTSTLHRGFARLLDETTGWG